MFLQTLFYLLGVHFLCDYPLQGDFLARAKAEGPLRLWHLFGHSMIHGLGVAIVTHSVVLGVCETVMHMIIDYGKTRKMTTFGQDQALHVACKVIWAMHVWIGGAL